MWSDDALIVATQVWAPCYFSGWTAARHWSLTEQVFRPTVVKTVDRVRASQAKLLDHDYLVSHIDPELLKWGLKSEWADGVRLSFSDPARTVVELLDDPTIGGGIRHVAEILSTYLDDNDPSLLVTCAERFGNRTVFKRPGFLLAASCECFDKPGRAIVISKRELERLSSEWGIRLDVIEKDYALGWLLAGIAQHPELSNTWIFKGGTCLRKCYYETFRFSEDLDFTVVDGGPELPKDLTRI